MSISHSIAESALMQAALIKSQIHDIAVTLPENEAFHIRKRITDTVSDLEISVNKGFRLKNKIERVRAFVNVVGKLMECKDYLDYLRMASNTEVDSVYREIDELSNLLLVNSGTLN